MKRALLLLICVSLTACGPEPEAPRPMASAPSATPGPAVTGELDSAHARIAELEARVTELEERRLAREREWLEYTRSIARLSSLSDLERAHFHPAVDPSAAPAVGDPSGPPEAPAPARDPAAEQRDRELLRSLRALLLIEQVSGLELLEVGHLEQGSTGPVVLRMLDDRGAPTGALCAEHLRLEASIAARTLVIVLEDGYERHGDERLPFPVPELAPDTAPVAGAPAEKQGVRRIVFTHVDPRPWIEAVPELFRSTDRARVIDDGRWDLSGVRGSLNQLLRQDAANGCWRVVALGGVLDESLSDVQLDFLDREGHLEKKIVADRMQIVPQTRGLLLELEDGAQLRGDEKTPFLDGRYRIFLPRAELEEWRAASLPGLSPPPHRARR